jgi:hypothetical protein
MAKDAPALAVEEPADRQLDFSALRSDLMEEVFVSCEHFKKAADSIYQPLFRPLTFSQPGGPIAIRPSAFQRGAFRSKSRLSNSPTP